MIVSKAVHPYQSASIPRNTPVGAVPITGGERDWHTSDPMKMQYGFDTLVAKKLMHPVMPLRAGSRSGEEVFQIYCSACHGYKGAGDGTVTAFVGAPSLMTAVARSYSDGYLYSMLRYGRGRMPMYGDKITRQDERWAVVDYVRSLQAAAPVPPAPVATPAAKTGAPAPATKKPASAGTH